MAHAGTDKDVTVTMRMQLNVAAEPAKANLLARSANHKARVTLAVTGAPVAGLKIHFRSASARIEGCSAFTNPEGVAECGSGGNLSFEYITDAIATGYDAVFDGDAKYEPAEGFAPLVV